MLIRFMQQKRALSQCNFRTTAVGAAISRPHRKHCNNPENPMWNSRILRFRIGNITKAILSCRAADSRPYIGWEEKVTFTPAYPVLLRYADQQK